MKYKYMLILVILFGHILYAQKINSQDSGDKLIIKKTSADSAKKTQLKLAAPDLIYPKNKSTDVEIVPEFIFRSVSLADRYDIQLSTDQYFSNIISESYREYGAPVSIDSIKFSPGIRKSSDYKNITTYYWRVKAYANNQTDESDWSNTYKYTTCANGSSVIAPSILSPANDFEYEWLNVLFSWASVNYAKNYQLQWGKSSTFNGFTFNTFPENINSYIADLEPMESYYCRIVAFNKNSISSFSIPYKHFYTGNQVILTSDDGYFDDGSGSKDYENNRKLYWLIKPSNGEKIKLTFLSMDTEQGYDLVKIYDGPNNDYPVLGEFSGNYIPESISSSASELLVEFSTDIGVTSSGWSARYTTFTEDQLKLDIQGPYTSLGTNEYLRLFYPDRPINADTLALVIKVSNVNPETVVKNIRIEAKLNNIPLKLLLNGGINIDRNNDGLIDQIPYRESVPIDYVLILVLNNGNMKGITENSILETKISAINGQTANIISIDTISYYTAFHPSEYRTFDYLKDAYSFPNPGKMSYKELLYNYFFTAQNMPLVLYQWLLTFGGRCYGMAYTSGDYFLNTSHKPFPDMNCTPKSRHKVKQLLN